MDIDTEETMNLTKWIDERTDAERAAILTHIVKGLVGNSNGDGDRRIAVEDEHGSVVGYVVPASNEPESPEDLAELHRREQLDGPCVSPEEALAAFKLE